MPTLKEAVANLDEVLAEPPGIREVHEDIYTDLVVDWQPKVDAIRAAVRDVALAMLMAAYDEGFAYARAEIIRLLGPEKAGG